MSAQSATTAVTHAVTVAAGVYAPGHLGELSQYLPFELVDDVLEQTRTVQRRLRLLPSRAGVYFVLALAMFPRLGYARVWGKLSAGLEGLDLLRPSEKALRDLRFRLGPAPLKALFEVVAGPLAQRARPVFDSLGCAPSPSTGLNSLKVPDTDRNRSWLGKIRHRLGMAGYLALRLMTLAETGTRGLLGATVGSVSARDEVRLARRLLPLLGPGMLILLDRAFDDARVPRRDHRHRGGAAGPGQIHPQAPGPGPPARRLLPVAAGQRPGRADHRSPSRHDRHRRHPRRRLLPADHHAQRPRPLPS